MPRKTDSSLKEGAVYISQKKASENWKKANPQEMITVRLPKGSRDIINDYVERKSKENPEDRKYSTDKGRPSVNAMLKALIEDEIGQKL